jgi:hypothetical protein
VNERATGVAGASDAAAAAADDKTPPERPFVDLIPDVLALARSQMASGLASMAEGTLRRQVARLQASGRGALEELDATLAVLAEALWRQGRPLAAGEAIHAIRSFSLERRRPIVMLIEAEALAAGGDPDRGAATMERVISAVGIDDAWRLRGGVPSRLPWPVPTSLRQTPRRVAPAPTSVPETLPERTAAAHARLEAARQAYGAGHAEEGDRELGLALRLDPRIAPEGIALIEPSLERQGSPERLLLYGDLLRASGRAAEASEAYDRAARA